MQDRDMSEAFETIGTWWLPDAPDRQVPGTLSCQTTDLVELRLVDGLRPMQSGPLRFDAVYPVVHGVTREQEAFSIFRCKGFYSLLFKDKLTKPETLWSNLAVVGAHLTEQQFYPELRCRIPALQVWLTPRVIQSAKEPKGFAHRFENIPAETIALASIGAELDLKLSARSSNNNSTATIVASGWLHIRPHEPKLLSWFLDQLGTIGSLLTFFAGKPMPPDRIELELEGHGFQLSVLTPRPSVKYCDHSEHQR